MIEAVYIRHKKPLVKNGRIVWNPTDRFYIMNRSLDPAARGHDYWPIEEYTLDGKMVKLFSENEMKQLIEMHGFLPDDDQDVL